MPLEERGSGVNRIYQEGGGRKEVMVKANMELKVSANLTDVFLTHIQHIVCEDRLNGRGNKASR